MSTTQVQRLAVPGFRGALIYRGDPDYEAARQPRNPAVDHRPDFVARCADERDVVRVAKAAAAANLGMSVLGLGSALAGRWPDGGVCLDLSALSAIRINARRRTALVGAGARWAAFDLATQSHGFAVTGSPAPQDSVAAQTLSGAGGLIARAVGLTCDSLIGATLVTASGRKVRASATENPDLFWGLQGGGADLGVATAFEFTLHPVGPMGLGGKLVFPAERAAEVLRAYRDIMAGAPDPMGGAATITQVSTAAGGAPEVSLTITVCWSDVISAGLRAIAPLRALGPIADTVRVMTYLDQQQLLNPLVPPRMRSCTATLALSSLSDAAIEIIVTPGERLSDGTVHLVPGGGAIARRADDDSACAPRATPFTVQHITAWESASHDEASIAKAQGLAQALAPWTVGPIMPPILSDDGAAPWAAAPDDSKRSRLSDLKANWDPKNLIR